MDEKTEILARKLPRRKLSGGCRWGPARKNINMFLADACYNIYLRNAYALDRIESLLEVPLDRDVAQGIEHDARKFGIPFSPGWNGVVHLTRERNAAYQNAAAEISNKLGLLARVHLDLRYWRTPQ